MVAGIGAAPAMRAKAASLWIRPRCDQAMRIWAALIGPTPGLVAESGRELVHEGSDLLLEHDGLVRGLQGALGAGAQRESERTVGVIVIGLDPRSSATGEQPCFRERSNFASKRIGCGD